MTFAMCTLEFHLELSYSRAQERCETMMDTFAFQVSTMVFIRQTDLDYESRRIRFLDVRFYLGHPWRGMEEYCQKHIANALFLDMETTLCDLSIVGHGRHPLPSAKKFLAWLRIHSLYPWNEDELIVCYDQTRGEFACRAWWMLRSLGCDNVAVLYEGADSWNGPTESGVSRKVTLVDQANVVDVEVLDWGFDKRFFPATYTDLAGSVVIDVRSSARFLSQVTPISPDTVPGHFPGAINAFFKEFDPFTQGSKTKLQNIVGLEAKRTVVMCGSGITSCYVIACMDHFGLQLPSLFVSSWSEIESMQAVVASL